MCTAGVCLGLISWPPRAILQGLVLVTDRLFRPQYPFPSGKHQEHAARLARRWSALKVWCGQSSAMSALMAQVSVYIVVHHKRPRRGVDCMRSRLPLEGREPTWLILPVVICLSQRLSHACLSISFYIVKLRMAH